MAYNVILFIVAIIITLIFLVINCLLVLKSKVSLKKCLILIIAIFLIIEMVLFFGDFIVKNFGYEYNDDFLIDKKNLMIENLLVFLFEILNIISINQIKKEPKKSLLVISTIIITLFLLLFTWIFVKESYICYKDYCAVKDDYILYIFIPADSGANCKKIYLYDDNRVLYYEGSIMTIDEYIDKKLFDEGVLSSDFNKEELIDYIKNYIPANNNKNDNKIDESYIDLDKFNESDFECEIGDFKVKIPYDDEHINEFLDAIVY